MYAAAWHPDGDRIAFLADRTPRAGLWERPQAWTIGLDGGRPRTAGSLAEGIVGLKEFVERPVKRLLLVEDDEVLRNSIVELIGGGDVEVRSIGTGTEALDLIRTDRFDCAIVDLMLPDMEWAELIGKMKSESAHPDLPVIVHTGKDLTKRETARIKKLAETIIIKDADSMERLVDETALFLHRDVANLNESQKNMIKRVNVTDPAQTRLPCVTFSALGSPPRGGRWVSRDTRV